MSKKPIIAYHHLDFAKRDFVVVVAETLPDGIATYNRRFKEWPWLGVDCAHADALCLMQDNGACLLAFTYATICASLICHEVTHATNGMFAHIGIKLNKGSDEAFAYHNDMLFRTVAELLAKHKVTIPLLP